MTVDLRAEVLRLYQEVDRQVAAAGPVCVASGRCCRFKEYGHTLFLSNLEADVLLAQALFVFTSSLCSPMHANCTLSGIQGALANVASSEAVVQKGNGRVVCAD
jgi:hypothetical protein